MTNMAKAFYAHLIYKVLSNERKLGKYSVIFFKNRENSELCTGGAHLELLVAEFMGIF